MEFLLLALPLKQLVSIIFAWRKKLNTISMNTTGKTLLEDVKERGKQRTKREEACSAQHSQVCSAMWEIGTGRDQTLPSPGVCPLVCRAPAPGQTSSHLGLAKYHKNKNQRYQNLRGSFIFSLHTREDHQLLINYSKVHTVCSFGSPAISSCLALCLGCLGGYWSSGFR